MIRFKDSLAESLSMNLKESYLVRSSAAITIKTMPERNSVPADFFGPYREELLQRYGLDRRQISSRELPISLAGSPTRRSLDVGDFDDPVLPVKRQAFCCFSSSPCQTYSPEAVAEEVSQIADLQMIERLKFSQWHIHW